MARTPRMFEERPTFAAQLARLERETAARLVDHGTAAAFTLHATPPPVYEAAVLFQLDRPDTGPAPLPGQLDLLPEQPASRLPARPTFHVDATGRATIPRPYRLT